MEIKGVVHGTWEISIANSTAEKTENIEKKSKALYTIWKIL